METTNFSGPPQGDDDASDAGRGEDLNFFAPAPAPTTVAEPAAEPAPEPEYRAEAEAPVEFQPEPVSEQSAEPAPTFDPGALDAPSLLAPEEVVPDAGSGLPMSLAIAAEEAATVDVESAPEPAVLRLPGLHGPAGRCRGGS